MSQAFHFFDELRPAGDTPIRVLAKVDVLSTQEGGRRAPFTHHFRPNHNFGDAENRHFFIGQLEVPEGEWVYPGESRELIITFLNVVGLAELLTIGKRWRIQEGGHHIANAEVLALLPATPTT